MIAQLSNLESRMTTFKDRNYVTGSKRKRGSLSTENKGQPSTLKASVDNNTYYMHRPGVELGG